MLNIRQEPAASRPAPAVDADATELTPRPHAERDAPPHRARPEPTLAELLWTVLERRWTVIAVGGVVLALGMAYLFVTPPVYESSVLIRVEGRTRPVPAFENLAPLFDVRTPTEGEVHVMRSRTVLGAVVDQLALDVEARPRVVPLIGDALARRHQGSEPAAPRFGLERFAWGGEKIAVGRLTVSDALLGEPLVLTAMEGGRYTVAASEGTVLLEGEVGTPATVTDGERTMELLVSELTARPGTEFALTRVRRMDVIESLTGGLRISEQGRDTGVFMVTLQGQDPARIAAILDAVATNYLRQTTERTSAEAAKTLRFLEAQLPVLKTNVDKSEAALNSFRRKNGTVNLPIEAESMLARLGELDRAIAESEVRAAEMALRYTGKHPDAPIVADRTAQLRAQRAAMETRMRALPDLELESTRLSRHARVATELYLLVLNRAEELRIAMSGWMGNVRVLEKAVVPHRPVSPKSKGVLTLSLLLGLVLGGGAAVMRQAFDRGVTDPEDLEAGARIPVFATIPRSRAQRRLARRGRRGRLSALSVAKPGDAAVEDLRSLRTSIQYALRAARNNVVSVSGLAPKAGKSFVSVNLAHLLAAAGGRVLLVDGDLRRGGLHRYFGLEAAPGLADVLSGTTAMDAALHSTDTPNVDLLPAGTVPANPAELLAGERLKQLLTEVGQKYGVVIVDTPPILSVSDSALVGRHAGVNLLVVRAGEHSVGEIAFVLKRLMQNGVAFRGAILNGVRPSMARYGRSGRYRRYYVGTA